MGRGGSSPEVQPQGGRKGGWLEFFCGHLCELGTMVLWAGECGVGRPGPAEGRGAPRGQRQRGGGFFLPCLPVSDPRRLLLTFLSVAFAMASWLWPAVRILWSLRSLPPVWLQGSG